MKTSKRNKLLGLALVGCFSLFSASNALAVAGDNILNRATLSYDVGSLTQTVIESSDVGNSTPGVGNGADTLFVEDRVINFTVAETAGITTNVSPSATLQVQTFQITNSGNGTQDFIFTALNRTAGIADPHGGINDNFDVVSSQVFLDTVIDGVYVPADDTAIFADQLIPTGTVTVFIVSTIPDDLTVANGDLAVMALVTQVADGSAASADDSVAANAGLAITNDDNGNVSPAGTYNNGVTVVAAGTTNNIADDPTTEQAVFNDPAGTIDSTGAAGAVQIGQASADSSYTVAAAALTVAKTSVALWDPINLAINPKSIPGGYVRYTITISNAAGAADADLTTLSDVLAAALNLDPDFGDGTAANAATNVIGDSVQITHVDNVVTNFCTGAADADGCVYVGGPGGTLTVDINAVMGAGDAQLTAGESLTITFNVIVQ